MGSPVSALAVELTWERPIGEINRYIITYSPVNNLSMENNIIIMDTTRSQVTEVVGNLSPNTTYQFTLLATSDAYGDSSPSVPINLTTMLQSGKYIV